jgi:outer membrane receptor protein involved in Fe transport
MIADFRQRLMASTLLVGAAAYASPALAQAVPPSASPEAAQATAQAVTDAGPQPEAEIVVTGSRIARPDLESTSPIAIVSSQEFQLQAGSANVENVLNDLPQVTATQSSTSNNPGGGVATVNLRGMGSQRTLVLVNGRRYVSYDVNQVVDLNTIPSSLIDRVDVVTGGQSAVYGSDAIAGVVNFILKRNFSGVQADASYDITENGDGQIFDTSVTLGTNFDDGRGNVTIFGEYTKRYPTFAGERRFSRFALSDDGDGSPIFEGGGSPSVPQGRIAIGPIFDPNFDTEANPDVDPPQLAPGLGEVTGLLDPDGEFCDTQDFAGGVNSCFIGAQDGYNFSPVNYLQVPQERYMIHAQGQYEISDHFRPYAELTFINNRVNTQLAATPISQGTPFGQSASGVIGPIQLQVASPFFTPEFQAALATIDANELTCTGDPPNAVCSPAATAGDGFVTAPVWSFRSVQAGPRANFDDRNAYRILGGVAGDITSGWDYDLSYMFARTKNAQRQLGNLAITNFLASVTTVFQDPVTGDTSPTPIPGGVLVCADASARAQGCVPSNIFGQGNLSPEAVNFISIGATNLETYSTQVVNATITNNDLLDLGAGGIGVALGAEWRKEAGQVDPDQFLASGNVAGFNPGLPTGGSYNVREFFAETRIPLLRDSFIHRLELNGAARYSHYSNAVGNVFTWAAGGELAPVPDITFRGQYQKAIRGPSVSELFLGDTVNFPGNADSCGTAAALSDPALNAICVAQFNAAGASVALIGNPAIQDPNNVNPVSFLGGNRNLHEESAKTWTVGAVLQPRFLPRFTATVDYFHIDVADTISQLGIGVESIGEACFTQHIQSFCDLIARNSLGQIESFTDLATNAGALKLRGLDVSAGYNLPLGPIIGPTSRLSFSFSGGYLFKSDFQPVASLDRVVHCAGAFGRTCGAPTPKWRHTLRTSLSSGPVTLSGQWRYLGKVHDDNPDNFLPNGDPGQGLFGVEHIGSRSYFDLTSAFDIGEHYQFAVGVSNLLDKDPPLIASAQNGGNGEQSNTFPTFYEVLGRSFFASARLKF